MKRFEIVYSGRVLCEAVRFSNGYVAVQWNDDNGYPLRFGSLSDLTNYVESDHDEDASLHWIDS